MRNISEKNETHQANLLQWAQHYAGKFLMALAIIALASGCDILDELEDKVDDKVKNPSLKLMAEGLTSPVYLTEAPDGSGRLFVLEQPGVIRIIDKEGKLVHEPFLDIRDKVVELMEHFDERGLLGLAFHPHYASNGRFFVYYTAPLYPGAPDDWDHTNVVAEYKVSSDPMKADKGSERVILTEHHPYFNHNGGTIAFGPMDKYLYISIGDGGNRDDQGRGHVEDWYDRNPGGNGQDIFQNLKGDILRIDVDGGHPYGIPADNPFVGKDGMDETYAYGLRNPYRFSFDMGGTHALYSQDAGQNLREEINLIVKGGNYGWNVKEGTLCFNAEEPLNPFATCPSVDPWGNPLLDPIIQFKTISHGHGNGNGGDNGSDNGHGGDHGQEGVGLVVVGGYVYRGSELPHLYGQYIFGTWSTSHEVPNGKVFISEPQLGEALWDFNNVKFKNTPSGQLNSFLLGFGQDNKGEVYVLTSDTQGPHGHTGKVYKMVAIAK